MSRRAGRRLALAAVAALALGALSPIDARADGARSRGEAIEMALERSGGRGKVLGVRETRDGGGRIVYEVKVLSDGRVRVHRIRGD